MINLKNKIWLLRPDEIALLPQGTQLDTYISNILSLLMRQYDQRDSEEFNPYNASSANILQMIDVMRKITVTVGVDELDLTTTVGTKRHTRYGFSNPHDENHSAEVKEWITMFMLTSTHL